MWRDSHGGALEVVSMLEQTQQWSSSTSEYQLRVLDRMLFTADKHTR